MPGPISRQRLYWLCQFLGWGLYALINALLINSNMRMPLRANIAFLSYGLCGILVTHLLRWWIHRASLTARPIRHILLHGLLMVPIGAFLLASLMQLLWRAFSGFWVMSPGFNQIAMFMLTLFNMCFLSLIWLLIYFTTHLVWRSIALREAQLNALQAQINPHFLFNSLNSLRGLILENPTAAQDAVTRLSQLMRYSLTQSRRATVPLEEELAAVRDYLAIESIRFEDRLRVAWHIAPGLSQIEVPPMSLQTLVENALKHGIANLPAGGTVEITATHQDHLLTLAVTNPGSLGPTDAPSLGTGLENIRQRLVLLKGPSARLNLAEVSGHVHATIELPTA